LSNIFLAVPLEVCGNCDGVNMIVSFGWLGGSVVVEITVDLRFIVLTQDLPPTIWIYQGFAVREKTGNTEGSEILERSKHTVNIQ
jgi:hypothetical protein